MTRTPEADEVVVECELDASPEKVWRALTVPELVSEWLDVEPLRGENRRALEPGYAIVEAQPFVRVRYAWRDEGTSRPDSVVTFDLAPRPEGRTWFRLTHSPAAATVPIVAANGNAPPVMLAA